MSVLYNLALLGVSCVPVTFPLPEDWMPIHQELFDAVCNGDQVGVSEFVRGALERETPAVALLMGSMVPAMREIGERFGRGEAFIPQMLVAARAMQAGMTIIEPLLAEAGHEPVGKAVVGTVWGDVHDIGKNLVGIMLKGAGFEVIDLGVNCTVEKFDEAVAQGAQVVCCSALLTTTMQYMKDVVEHFGANDDVKVIVGGAPVTQGFADDIGADGYAEHASGAAKIVCARLGIPHS